MVAHLDLKFCDACGFHDERPFDLHANSLIHDSNRSLRLGYLPVVGTFIGLGRICLAFRSCCQDKPYTSQARCYYFGQCTRGSVETTSLALFFLGWVDACMTAERKADPKKGLKDKKILILDKGSSSECETTPAPSGDSGLRVEVVMSRTE